MEMGGIWRFLEIIMYFDLLMLRVNLLAKSQSETLLSSVLTSVSKREKFLFCAHRKVSSANNLTKREVASGRSLIKIRNNRGPKIEPCGTPKIIFNREEVLPLTLTN